MSRKRLHPLHILFSLLKGVREMLFPFIAVILFGQSIWVLWGVLAVVVIGLLTSVIGWWRFTYAVEDAQLHITQGLIIRKNRYISREKIHSLDISQNILHQWFNLVKLQIETAGGKDEAEAVLSAISKNEAELLQQLLAPNKTGDRSADALFESAGNDVSSSEARWYMSRKMMWLMAATSGGVGVVVSGIFVFLSQFDEMLSSTVADQAFEYVLSLGFVLIGVFAFILLIVLYLVAMIVTLLKYARFTLSKTSEQIKISRGLLNKRQRTIDLSKIQAVRVQQNLIRQWLGVATVYVESAGSAKEETGFSTIIAPLLPVSEVPEVLERMLPDYIVAEDSWTRSPKRARIRYLIRASWIWVIVAATLSAVLYPFGLLAWLVVAGTLVFGFREHQVAAVRTTEKHLLFRYHNWSKHTVIVKKQHMQTYEIKRTLLQRKARLAHLSFSIMAGSGGKTFQVKDMEIDVAESQYDWFSKECPVLIAQPLGEEHQ
ncbi:PH domain-containing protein [Bacillaceae bacterium SIJ1]|uniref:PH domain-containing protein n=1 Tax=Litoribacterium kuwaitense TaxID=1398745 RepID=UPI0013EDEA88|nr:PH domain-containing protein [Litoribacterium kuwaitense]NGP46256.1 PH domain-containing protein [Litoribacterium kuwaitense]